MEAIRTRLGAGAVLALFAMLALVLVPSLSQVLQPSPFAGIGVCSTPDSPSGGMPPGHCPLCAHAVDGPLGPPGAASRFAPATAAAGMRVAASDRLALPRHAWASAPARAPPHRVA